ncbi:uncharacterized protein LOC125951524 [Anopheles darlingi]|uniref:uncharacterized protein LOC125951524 n=1 Tax=Anopheles darlingi TaxID=43151 RepID=UPI0021002967|nr:uncharacterized protein LOC125951524 [Anopheles darlingi]
MKYLGVWLPLLLLGSILLGQNAQALSVRSRRDLAEQAMGAVMQGAAKIKEALDHGIGLKSEGKRSIDIFGFKFGTNTGINGGFGDAANSGASENTDDLVRRRRSLDVLSAARAASLMPQSPFGTNVNIVKVSSVSNVNNFGELPPVESGEVVATTTVAARRKRSPDILQVGNYEKKSFSLDSEIAGGKVRKTHEALESIRGSNRVLVKQLHRSKRAPQTSDTDDEESSTDQGPPKGKPRGRPRGPPPGGCRGPPRGPPPEDADDDSTSTTTSNRRKRDTSHSETIGKRPKRSPVPCRGGDGGGKGARTTVAPDGEVRRKRSAASHASHAHSSMDSNDYSAESESVEAQVGTSALNPTTQERRKRLIDFGGGDGDGGGASGKIGSWFEQMAHVFMETVGKVVAATKNAFSKGSGQQGM